MPKRKRDNADSDYDAVGDNQDNDSDNDIEDDNNEAYDNDFEPQPKKRLKKKPSKAVKQAWRDLVSSKRPDNETSARLTENGGYAHTLDSKMKISKANKGNTPWNKVCLQLVCRPF